MWSARAGPTPSARVIRWTKTLSIESVPLVTGAWAPADQVGARHAPAGAGLHHAYRLTVDAAEARLEAVEDALREAEGRRAEEDQLFAEARMARRTLEKLRERREADHALETGREEQRDLDELTRPSPKDPDMERTA